MLLTTLVLDVKNRDISRSNVQIWFIKNMLWKFNKKKTKGKEPT